MRRIVIVAPHFPEYSLEMAKALAADADVLLFVDRVQFSEEFKGRSPTFGQRLQLVKARYHSLMDLISIIRQIRRYRPDIVHLQEAAGFRKALISAVIVATCKAKLALSVHDPVPHSGRDAAIAKRIYPLKRYVRKKCRLKFVHGEFCKDEYLHSTGENAGMIAVIDHGEILKTAQPVIKESDEFRILLFGRMEQYKGLEVFCEALEMIDSDYSRSKVKILGTGPELDRLEDRFRRFPNVEVDNQYVDPVPLMRAIEDADCIVLPYLNATQSGVLAAAFANGRFVIASAVGGIPDVVVHLENGLLVSPGDAPALAAALNECSQDRELRRRLMLGARNTADVRLSWQAIAIKIQKAYSLAI